MEAREVKLKELPYFLGLQPGPKTYGHKIKQFDLPGDGSIEYAQWLHPHETEKEITQQSVDELRKFLSPEMWPSISARIREIPPCDRARRRQNRLRFCAGTQPLRFSSIE